MQTRKILIVTKTYPTISQKYRETVCTAGILLNEEEEPIQWIRIYPVRYRDLDFEKKYKKWSMISARIEENPKDTRQESYRIDDDSIQVIREVGTADGWQERRKLFENLTFRSIDDMKSQEKSLGILKPFSLNYYHESTEREWPSSQQVILDQGDFFRADDAYSNLEKIPYKFYYKFQDKDKKEHTCSIIDWEISQLFRRMRNASKASKIEDKEIEALEKVRIKLADQLTARDLHFLMGNLNKYRNSFVIIGLIYPPVIESRQLSLI
ncbi:MAG: hypothetical protein AAF722_09900 [Cyanobacteria bacterium P01_C01_bin.70]